MSYRQLTLLQFSQLLWTELESESYVTTDGQSASLSWNKAPIWGLRPDFYYCHTFVGLLMLGAFSDERTGLSFTVAAGLRQRSHLGNRVPWDSRPSPLTTRRATVVVFDPASTRDEWPGSWMVVLNWITLKLISSRHGPHTQKIQHCIVAWCRQHRKHSTTLLRGADHIENIASYIVECWKVFTEPLPRNWLHNPIFLLLRECILNNGCFCDSTVLAWSKYATIFCYSQEG
jgi:hypothetical protein